MDINKRDRSVLKSYFVERALPTEENFAELIDGMINQREDGVVKQPGSPLSLQASGDENSYKKVLQLFEDFADADPAWTLTLRPRSVVSDPGSGKRGFSIGTPGGVSRLFIDHASGRVGVGTVEPQARLHVAGEMRVDGKLGVHDETGALRVSIDAATGEIEVGVGVDPTDNKDLVRINGNMQIAGTIKQDAGVSLHDHDPANPEGDDHLRNSWKRKSTEGYDWEYPGYFRDHFGMVHLRGMLVSGVTAHERDIFVLREGYRPKHFKIVSVYTSTTQRSGTLNIHPTGHVRSGGNLGGEFSMDGVCFQVSDLA